MDRIADRSWKSDNVNWQNIKNSISIYRSSHMGCAYMRG